MKDFKKEFWKFYKLIEDKIPFCFVRFSDGEFFILKNEEVKLAENYFITGNTKGNCIYTEEEQKHFLPGRDEFYRQELLKSFKHKQENYFKGICGRSDVGEEGFKFQMKLLETEDEGDLTFANLFINSNYPLYMNRVIPLISKGDRPIAMVLNEKCDVSKLPFKINKEFRIGNNCLIRNYSTAKEVSDFLSDKKDWIVLCSAASLTNVIGYYSFKNNPNNTIIDIGSSLNPLLGLEGWKYSRDYLKHFWMGQTSHFCLREELW